MKAIVYARWSSQEQGKEGTTTLDRQIERCGAFAECHGFEIVETITDQGVSAWTGKNIGPDGNLGKLKLRLVRDGGHNHVIIVEKLDRISRQSPLVVLNFLQELCLAGVTIMSADGRHTIANDDLMKNMMGVLSIVFEAFRGFDESEAKSYRLANAWRIKRERGQVLTGVCPGWMRINENRDGFELIEERAAIVRRIFNETENGIGKATIARRLNEDGVPVFGRSKDGWRASYIRKITTNIAAVGSYQPHVKARADVRRTPIGDVIHDYFPAVISEDQFARVNDPSAVKLLAQQRPGRSLVNLFGGLNKCACGSIMTFRAKGPAKRAGGHTVREDYLVCDRALRGRGCDNKTHFNYERIEGAILDKLLHLALDDTFFRKPDLTGGIETEIATHTRRLADDEKRMKRAYSMILEDDSDDFAADQYRTIRKAVTDRKAMLASLQDKLADALAATDPVEHLRRVDEVRGMMNSDDQDERYQARAKVKLALNDLIDTLTFGLKGHVGVMLVDRARLFSMDRNGMIITDHDLRSMFPQELDADGRFGPVTVIEGGVERVANELTAGQEGALAGYLRRQAS